MDIIIKLRAPVKDYIWGGTRLREQFGKSGCDPIAESWELSCHPDGISIIDGGEADGMLLSEYLRRYPEAAGENAAEYAKNGELPVMVKLIDARERLSLQVHPDDEYALAHEGERGKNELWYVVDCEPDSFIIYGLREKMTRGQFMESVRSNTILERVNVIPVKKGDMFMIPAGMLHAIGEGCLMAEIQQSSNITYRVYDYGRPRELHIEKAADVIGLEPVKFPVNGKEGFPYFTAVSENIDGECDVRCRESSFTHVLVIDGSGEITGTGNAGNDVKQLKKGDSFFVPAGVSWRIKGKCSIIYTVV